MRLFLELHKRLQVIGRYIGAFTIFTVALLLYAAPFLCALSASVYLALGINILIGGGVWVFIAILFGLMTFFVVYDAAADNLTHNAHLRDKRACASGVIPLA